MTEIHNPQTTTEPTPHTTDPSPAIEPIARGKWLPQNKMTPQAVRRAVPERVARALECARQCARIADDNRAKDIVLLDLRDVTPLVDYFVIATAPSRRQSHAIADEIAQAMKRQGESRLGIEGSEEGRWILMDFGDFVVHIFSADARDYYALEDIWGDAPRLDWHESGPPAPSQG
jgi:ribosome-associated protein